MAFVETSGAEGVAIMAVLNIHTRTLPASDEEIGGLIDGLAGREDRLWPGDRWPPMRFDRPLGVGAIGGHGPIRYTVEAYEPGRWVRFRFTGPRGFRGFHEFTVHPDAMGIELRHTLAMHTRGCAVLGWPLIFRWLHDACLEDCLDRAERATTGIVRAPARQCPYVRLLRRFARYLL